LPQADLFCALSSLCNQGAVTFIDKFLQKYSFLNVIINMRPGDIAFSSLKKALFSFKHRVVYGLIGN